MGSELNDDVLVKFAVDLNLLDCRDLVYERTKDGIEVTVPSMKYKALARKIQRHCIESNPASSRVEKWIDCRQELPPYGKNHCWLAWITCQNKAGGYIDLVSYGDYVCQNEDIRPGDPLYLADNDDGNMKGEGWYREEETHGGEYDYIFTNLNGKVTHWMPLPDPPAALPEGSEK